MRRQILAASFLLATAAVAQTAPPPSYEVYAIRYGTIPDFPLSGLVKGEEAGKKLDIAMMVWLIRGGGRNVLVDTGFGLGDVATPGHYMMAPFRAMLEPLFDPDETAARQRERVSLNRAIRHRLGVTLGRCRGNVNRPARSPHAEGVACLPTATGRGAYGLDRG